MLWNGECCEIVPLCSYRPGCFSVSDVLSVLQYRLDSGSLLSTLKVYVAAIASFRSPLGGQSIGRHALVVSFSCTLHLPRPPSVPPWVLEVVLIALHSYNSNLCIYAFSRRFYPKRLTVHLGYTFSQGALLLALASDKRIGDLHAFSVDSDCIHFGPGDCGVTFWPRITCLKSLSTPFRTQTVSLSALSSESSTSRDANAQISCAPSGLWGFTSTVRPAFGNLTSYLVCYGGCAKGRIKTGFPLDCGRYQGCLYEPSLECPFHIRVYSTRFIAFCAWLRGMSIQDIYFAAGWSSLNTFARFYKLDGQSFAS